MLHLQWQRSDLPEQLGRPIDGAQRPEEFLDEENCRAARVEDGLGYYCAHCATYRPDDAALPATCPAPYDRRSIGQSRALPPSITRSNDDSEEPHPRGALYRGPPPPRPFPLPTTGLPLSHLRRDWARACHSGQEAPSVAAFARTDEEPWDRLKLERERRRERTGTEQRAAALGECNAVRPPGKQ